MDASPSPSPADGPESENPPRAGALRSSLDQWQVRLLPVMVGVLIGLAAFFFIATLAQMAYLERSISDVPSVILPPLSASDEALEATGANAAISARQLEILAAMEAYLVERRYHQASVLLMAGLWTRYLGFITGMVLALVGASFILGKLEGPPSELEGKGAGIEGSLKTASPGIILVVLGAALMLATIVNRDTYETRDVSVYLPSWGAAGISQGPPAAPTFIPLETPAAPTSPVQ
jgi:hypothetical protein